MEKATASNNLPDRIKHALTEDLHKSGLEVDVVTEVVPDTRLTRVIIVSRTFQQLGPAERQDLIWRIMDNHFDSDEQLRISMVYTLSPDEINWDEDE